MMLLVMFVIPGFIFMLQWPTSVKSFCSDEKIMCRCGASDATFLISCIDDNENEDPCEAYEHCETCENDLAHCLTCPRGYRGPFCDQDDSSGLTQDVPGINGNRETGIQIFSRSLSCQDLRTPKFGSFSCWYQGYEKECTGRCFPGYSFPNREREIKLVCQSGVWMPFPSFPQCTSEGYCTFDLIGGGFFNCTTGPRGRYCSITCYNRGQRPTANQYHCVPGSSWDPPLPYCAKEIEVADGAGRVPVCECQNGGSCSLGYRRCTCPPDYTGNLCEHKVAEGDGKETESKSTCECENGGSCNSNNRQCSCPPGYKGRLCELKEYTERHRCPHPDPLKDGEKKNTDGSIVTRSQQFHEGSSIVYSCNSGFALVGDSLLTCTKQGTWSNSVPTCNSLQDLRSMTRPNQRRICPDPGQVENGIRRRTNDQRAARVQALYEGSSVVFSCNDGYALVGDSLLTCSSSGKWSTSLPKCRRRESSEYESTDDGLVYCKDPGVNSNGIKSVSPWITPRRRNSNSKETEYPQGTKIDYSCKDGYNLRGQSHITCLFSGTWSSSIPSCTPKPASVTREAAYCEHPGNIRNGMISLVPVVDPRTRENVVESSADLPEGAKLVYNCNTGFSIRGQNIIECKSTGTWSSTPPTCETEEVQGCGHSFHAVTGKILNGDKTVEGEWPWQVAYAENRRMGMTMTCGAVLINHRTALTAAHCVLPRRLDKTFLYFGKYYSDFNKDDDNEVLSRKATEFIVHPRYNRRNMDNDIALVRFSDVPYSTRIQPICLPTRETTETNLQHDNKGWVTGWGTTENGTESDALLMAELPVVSTSRCRETYKRLNLGVLITNNMYCAGYESGKVDSCSGDSGGPMVFYNSQTRSYVLEGIVSFGIKGPTGSCGQRNRYGVYVKVSNYVSWIQQYI